MHLKVSITAIVFQVNKSVNRCARQTNTDQHRQNQTNTSQYRPTLCAFCFFFRFFPVPPSLNLKTLLEQLLRTY
jgi:hypothetical protein